MAELGALVVDADQLARDAVSPGTAGLAAVVQSFGPEILTSSGELDRQMVGSLIFSNPERRKELEQIIHPIVRQLFANKVKELVEEGNTQKPRSARNRPNIIVYAVPLLFEAGVDLEQFHKIVVITAPLAEKIRRVSQRDNLTQEAITQRMAAQLSDEEKASRADFVIENNGSLEQLKVKAKELYLQLQRAAAEVKRARTLKARGEGEE